MAQPTHSIRTIQLSLMVVMLTVIGMLNYVWVTHPMPDPPPRLSLLCCSGAANVQHSTHAFHLLKGAAMPGSSSISTSSSNASSSSSNSNASSSSNGSSSSSGAGKLPVKRSSINVQHGTWQPLSTEQRHALEQLLQHSLPNSNTSRLDAIMQHCLEASSLNHEFKWSQQLALGRRASPLLQHSLHSSANATEADVHRSNSLKHPWEFEALSTAAQTLLHSLECIYHATKQMVAACTLDPTLPTMPSLHAPLASQQLPSYQKQAAGRKSLTGRSSPSIEAVVQGQHSSLFSGRRAGSNSPSSEAAVQGSDSSSLLGKRSPNPGQADAAAALGGTFIAINLHNSQHIMANLLAQLLAILHALQCSPVYVSIYESGSDDLTPIWLTVVEQVLGVLQVPHRIIIQGNLTNEKFGNDRIKHLAAVRNAALQPLYQLASNTAHDHNQSCRHNGQQTRHHFAYHQDGNAATAGLTANGPEDLPGDLLLFQPTRILFINDVVFCAQDALRLLMHQQIHGADLACGMDFEEYTVPTCGFRDIWVARDVSGRRLLNLPPYITWASEDQSADRLANGYFVPVSCCWNGMVALNAKPFLCDGLRFRRQGPSDKCFESECSYMCEDMHRLGYHNMLMDSNVRVAYNHKHHVNLRDDGTCNLHIRRRTWNETAAEWTQALELYRPAEEGRVGDVVYVDTSAAINSADTGTGTGVTSADHIATNVSTSQQLLVVSAGEMNGANAASQLYDGRQEMVTWKAFGTWQIANQTECCDVKYGDVVFSQCRMVTGIYSSEP